jgi:hypothetical protein
VWNIIPVGRFATQSRFPEWLTDMKIFQIGFNRCGTRTLHSYFSANGLQGVHFDGGRLARRIFSNQERGRDLLAGYEHFDVFTDMECLEPARYLEAYKLYPQFAAQYPGAVFILNTRDREAWIRSRLRYGDGRYVARHKAYLKIASDEELAEHWRKEWHLHHARVTEFFARGEYRFFVCRIETDLPRLLGHMLPELALDPSTYSVQNRDRRRKTIWSKFGGLF